MRVLLQGGCFFEGARWHAGSWWVSDLHKHHVLRISVDGAAEVVAEIANSPSGLGWMPDGSMLIVSMKDARLLRWQADGTIREHAAFAELARGYPNDMIVDSGGRAYVGCFGFDLFGGGPLAKAPLVRVDPDGRTTVVADDLQFPNGLVITRDRRTLIVAESFGARLTAFTMADDGSLRDRRVWAQLGTAPPWESVETLHETDCVPDGCVIDVEDHVWVADPAGFRALRVSPAGKIVAEVRAPENLPIYSCTLGGLDGRELLLCVAADYDPGRCIANPQAILYTHPVDVPCTNP